MNRINDLTETIQHRIIFPGDLNNHNTLFGGKALEWMDEVAHITATRFAKKEMITISSENIRFINPVNSGDIIEIKGKIQKKGRVRLTILVSIYIEEISTSEKSLAIEGNFTFVAINNNNKPIPIFNKTENKIPVSN
jgi:acyl-CoA hydrolase